MPSCSVTLKNLLESDSGIWEVAFKDDLGEGKSEMFHLTVIPGDLAKEDEQEDDITWLTPIDFPTRTDQNIDISLSKTSYSEDCYVRKPGGSDVMTTSANIEGVTIYSSSDFVSCRITIGPMDESLLGDWALCGKRADNNGEQDRCQLVRITWNNNARPDSQWGSINQARFNHVVNLGGTLAPVVLGSGTRITCHVITPKGEDLVIDDDSDYPNLKLVPTGSSTCSVVIGPIEASMLGDWTLYGKFRDFTGLNEVRLPMNLFLYDENNPYDQAYNVTVRDPVRRAVNLGSTLNVEVTSTGKVDSCQCKTPSGETFDLDGSSYEGASFVNVGESIACRLTIGPVEEKLLGDWRIIGKFSDNGRFTELQQSFQFIEEDPENPIIDEDIIVQNLNEQSVNTDFGNSHRLTIHSDAFIAGESCHIRTPGGLQYTIMEGFTVPGVEVIEENGVECGVIVHVQSEDAIGTWTLIARATRHSQQIERRLPFTINVEEIVEAIPKEVTIIEGNNLYVRLASPTDQYETCQLVGPIGAVSSHVVDPLHVQSCGYIITNITAADTGIWEIVYGSRTTYRASIVVDVTVSSGIDTDFTTTIDLIRDRSTNKTVGPESAVYCRLVDPQEGKPLVTTHVAQAKPIVTVSCSVATEAAVHACKFRDPQGKILLAASGVSEDRYVFHGAETREPSHQGKILLAVSGKAEGLYGFHGVENSYQSEVKTHECGLQITNPLVSDLGLWRCAIETEEDTYYGFMAVLCPWALMDPDVAAIVQQEPILKTQRELVEGVEDGPVTLSCAVEAAIRYCYFRGQNGTTFSVSPGMTSPDMEYVGAGFEAGECGVRFHGMRYGDSGRWSCHVEAMRVDHFYSHGSNMIVEGQVYDGRALDYCRYVRIDGFGFTTDNIPSEYTNSGFLTTGMCQLTIRNPTILDMHPWTVVAKIRGQDTEISRDTMEAILIGESTSTPTPAPGGVEVGVAGGQRGLSIFFYVFMSVLLVSILLGVWLGPKKSREWTYSRASAFRRSFQNSFRKQPLPPMTPNNKSDLALQYLRSVHRDCDKKLAKEDEQQDDKTWLTPIDYPTRTGQHIDITLSKTTNAEDCYVRKPGGTDVMTTNANIEGVTIQSSSDFVSCRITIGPMDESLLGDWALCGKRADNNGEQDRCQLVRISWNNNAHPDAVWGSITEARFNRLVFIGGSLAPTVDGSGTRISCHIITPQGEDLVINADSDYPNLRLMYTGSSTCSVSISPVEASMLGHWTIYGKYRDLAVLNEVRRPLNLYLFGQDVPNDQAYDVIVRVPVRRAVNLGINLNVEVTSTGKVDSCQFKTPSEETFDLDSYSYEGASFVNVGESIACRLAIGPFREELLGDWTIIGQFSHNGRFTEIHQIFQFIAEDPENPIIDEDRTVQNLDEQRVDSDFGDSHRLTIHSDALIVGESCHIRTPGGLQYTVMEGFSVPGVDVIEENGVECGVIVHVLSEDAVGTWTLIARATSHSQQIERRLPFTINVEEIVEAIPKEETIIEGNDLYVRLASPTDQYETCQLVGPIGAVSSHVVDPLHVQSCGYIITNITTADTGIWEIVYGSRTTYRASIVVNVTVSSGIDTDFTTTIDLIRDRSVNKTVGPESAVYCRLVDPQEGKPLVITHVGTWPMSPLITVSCSLAIEAAITNPLVSDLGLWRCAVETEGDIYYAFIDVLDPWALMNPNVAANVQQGVLTHLQLNKFTDHHSAVPILKSHRELVEGVEDRPVTFSCAVEAAIRYCYFRGPNGTTFSVSPGMTSPDMEYVGAGFEAGECGVRLHGMRYGDSGRWSCHVGLVGDAEEQRDQFQLDMHETMIVDHFYSHDSDMIVEGRVYDGRALDYCRYVRIDGFGFTTESIPSEYTNSGFLTNGVCQLTIRNPTILDMHPWTVVAKIRGQDNEISRDTMEAILIGEPAPEINEIGSPGRIHPPGSVAWPQKEQRMDLLPRLSIQTECAEQLQETTASTPNPGQSTNLDLPTKKIL
ncbi:Uncharacterized protein OBRU01_03354 [Operophtera brumata]|uniref:Immunoglobulin domain-containing protein n=1 Tax=Operophtera brumata TaxID=104452 RepID=A0A0L7LR73_OPEBR|nr:Uncharacterized protein OBRU01_03354 [Operophtera brumata]